MVAIEPPLPDLCQRMMKGSQIICGKRDTLERSVLASPLISMLLHSPELAKAIMLVKSAVHLKPEIPREVP